MAMPSHLRIGVTMAAYYLTPSGCLSALPQHTNPLASAADAISPASGLLRSTW